MWRQFRLSINEMPVRSAGTILQTAEDWRSKWTSTYTASLSATNVTRTGLGLNRTYAVRGQRQTAERRREQLRGQTQGKQSITFISRLNALDCTKLRSWNLRCIKILKDKIKAQSDMFRIVCDPSSGSIKLYLTEICSGSLMFVACLIGVWQRNFEM